MRTIFKFFPGGYGQTSFQVELRHQELHGVEYDWVPLPEEMKVIAIAGNPDWERLLAFLQKCSWQKEYYHCDGDGTP